MPKVQRPRVLVLVDWYLPGFKGGGPIRSIANIVGALADSFQFLVVTRDRDMGDVVPYDGVSSGEWVDMGDSSKVLYLSPQDLRMAAFWRVVRGVECDVIYVNSFFSQRTTVALMLGRWLGRVPTVPCIVAPRGELSEGALALKALKKASFIVAARAVGLYADVYWHATTSKEAREIEHVMGVDPGHIIVAQNISTRPPVDTAWDRGVCPGRPLRVVFLSRISRKKNLDYALRVLRKVRIPVVFSIYGPREDPSYWAECEKLIADMPSHVRCEYRGAVTGRDVFDVLRRQDLFFLPTRGENYGHVVAEAIQAGVPLLLSDTTPWRDLWAIGIGWDIELGDPDRFVEIIERVGRMEPSEYDRLTRRVAEYGHVMVAKDSAIDEARTLLWSVSRLATRFRGSRVANK